MRGILSLTVLAFFLIAVLGGQPFAWSEGDEPGSTAPPAAEELYEDVQDLIEDEHTPAQAEDELARAEEELARVKGELARVEDELARAQVEPEQEEDSPVNSYLTPEADKQPVVEGPLQQAESENDARFYFASFDTKNSGGAKTSIPAITVRFYGAPESINPADFTDMVLTRDGAVVENPLTYGGFARCFEWGFETVTDFYFSFETPNNTPGTYGFTGKYKGTPFTIYNKILEGPLGDEPADLEALYEVHWCYMPDIEGRPTSIDEISFFFSGVQQAFYLADLSDMKLTRDGEEIAFSVDSYVFRYLEASHGGPPETSFNLLLKEGLTASGTYVLTGSYRGKSFISASITIP